MNRNFALTVLLTLLSITLKAQNIKYPTSIKSFNLKSVYSSTISVGDIDNDGDNDILEFNSDTFCYAWLENNGQTNFNNYHFIKNLKYRTYSQVKILDVNNDKINDIVAFGNNPYLSSNGFFYFLKGIGNGNFESTYYEIYFSNFFDYDYDGDMDILYINDSSVYINRNTINGFANPEKIANLPKISPLRLQYVKVTDLNSDNHPDLLFLTYSNSIAQYVFRSLNDGNNDFLKLDTLDINSNFNYASLLTEDMNNDGYLDIILPSYQTYWLESQNMAKTYSKHHLIVAGTNLIIEDINKDSYKDVVTSGYDYMVNNKNNTFTRNYLSQTYNKTSYSITSEDIDNDKDIDVVMGLNNSKNEHEVAIYFNSFCAPTSSFEDIRLCKGDSIFLKGEYIRNNELLIDTLTNSIGCDSFIYRFINFYPCSFSYIDTTICVDSVTISSTILQCDTIFDNWMDTSLNNMIITCHRAIYKKCENQIVRPAKGDSLIIFPNPTNDKIFIKDPYLKYFELFDFKGQFLYKSDKKWEIEMKFYPKGFYFLKIYHQNGLNKVIKIIRE